MKNIVKYASLSLFAMALAVAPMLSSAQDATTNAPAMAPADGTTPAPVKKKKGAGLPFHGKITALDATASTLTVGELSLTITSKSKISTNNVPATLADFQVGEAVTGAYKKAEDGTLNVLTLRTAKKKAAAAQ
jgi:hypothetical protein